MSSGPPEFITATHAIPGRASAEYAVLRGDPSDGLPGVKGVVPSGNGGVELRIHGGPEVRAAARRSLVSRSLPVTSFRLVGTALGQRLSVSDVPSLDGKRRSGPFTARPQGGETQHPTGPPTGAAARPAGVAAAAGGDG